jgi:hypothetical protein
MQMIGGMIFVILFLMLSPYRAGIAAQLKMSLITSCSEKGTAQLPGKYPEAALFVGL